MDEHSSNNASIIVFSGNLDKVLASFVIATGVASMGMDVMGLKREELIDEVDDVTDVASFIADAKKLHLTLFV